MQLVSGHEMRPVTEIRIAGFGGQGGILAAAVIGKAKAIYQGDFATMTQNFGPEARGGACSAQVVLSSSPILYPYVTEPDVLVVMSQEAYTRFTPERRHANHRAGPRPGERHSHRHPRIRRPRDAPRRRTWPQGGAQYRHGRFLR